MLSSFLSSAYNYSQGEAKYLPSALNVPQFAYSRQHPLTSSSTSAMTPPTPTSTPSDTMEVVVKQEVEDDTSQSPGPSPPSAIKFSIDSILGLKTGTPARTEGRVVVEENLHTSMEEDVEENSCMDNSEETPRFPWLQCTRYKPPKLPRIKRKDGVKKRKLGRNPRVPFTQHQVAVLEDKFRRTHYLSSMDVAELSTALNLSDNRVKIWFQNRRARERRDREAAQTTTAYPPKPSQPLMVPSVTWSVSPHTSSTAFAQLRSAIQQTRVGFIPSAFSLYLPRPTLQEHSKCSTDVTDAHSDKY